MRIVGKQDIGPLATTESPSATYYWPLYLHVAGLIMPLALVAFLFRAANRNRGAWWAIIVALLFVIAWGLEQSGSIRFVNDYGFNVFHHAVLFDGMRIMLFALAFLLLFSDKLVGLSRMATIVYAVLMLVLAGVIGLLDVYARRMDLYLLPTGLVYGALAFATLAALMLAGVGCRKRYSSLRYLIRFFVIFLSGAAIILFIIPVALHYLSPGYIRDLPYILSFLTRHLPRRIAEFLPFMLSFLLLAIWSPTYRTRFHAIFRLPGMDYEQGEMYNKENIGNNEP